MCLNQPPTIKKTGRVPGAPPARLEFTRVAGLKGHPGLWDVRLGTSTAKHAVVPNKRFLRREGRGVLRRPAAVLAPPSRDRTGHEPGGLAGRRLTLVKWFGARSTHRGVVKESQLRAAPSLAGCRRRSWWSLDRPLGTRSCTQLWLHHPAHITAGASLPVGQDPTRRHASPTPSPDGAFPVCLGKHRSLHPLKFARCQQVPGRRGCWL